MKVKVQACLGVKVPMEHQPTVYIEQEAVDVEMSVYYQRRIADGDLIVVNASQKSKKSNVEKVNDNN